MSIKTPVVIWVQSFPFPFSSINSLKIGLCSNFVFQQQREWIPESWLLFDGVDKCVNCKICKRYWNGLQSWKYILNKHKLRKIDSICSVLPSKWSSFAFHKERIGMLCHCCFTDGHSHLLKSLLTATDLHQLSSRRMAVLPENQVLASQTEHRARFELGI